METITPQVVRVGEAERMAQAQPKSGMFRITRRTFIALGILLSLLLVYTAYAAIRHSSFANAVAGNPPSYCNATLWNTIVHSDNMFGVVSLNPVASYSAYAAQAAIWCKKINEANKSPIDVPIGNAIITVSTTVSTSTSVKNALPMG